MSPDEPNGQLRLDATANSRELIDQWVNTLAQVLESMTDQKPSTRWQAVSGTLEEVGPPQGPGEEIEVMWWQQALNTESDAIIWIGAQRATWLEAGGLTLKAAGLETVELSEARNTWCEILGQTSSPVARSISAMVGREVNWQTGTEPEQAPGVLQWASVFLAFAGEPLPPLLVGVSPKLVELISAPPAPSESEGREPEAATPDPLDGPSVPLTSRTLDLLLDVDLPISISFGTAELTVKDVLKLTTGSIVELNRGVNDPVEVLVNRCLIAHGEVVVVEGNYGVRIQKIASRQDRLRSIR